MLRAVGAFLFLFAVTSAIAADSGESRTTIVISARADLPDPNFKDSIILVMNDIAPAPVGLIVNRPTRISVHDLFPEIPRLANLHDKVYFGGPVDLATLFFLFRSATPPPNAAKVVDDVYLSADAALLRTLLERESPMDGLRLFIGYAGWARGQLEDEIARGNWSIAPADSRAIFGRKPEHPWPAPPSPGGEQRT